MIQKYVISQNKGNDLLIIEEFAVVDRIPKYSDRSTLNENDFSLLHKETYESETIESAIPKGKSTLISELRTQYFYPIGLNAGMIADSVIDFYQSKDHQAVELLFDDLDFLSSATES